MRLVLRHAFVLLLGLMAFAACGLTTRNPPNDDAGGSEATASGGQVSSGGTASIGMSMPPQGGSSATMAPAEGGSGGQAVAAGTGGAQNAAAAGQSGDGSLGGATSSPGGATSQGGVGASDCDTFGTGWASHDCDIFSGATEVTCPDLCRAQYAACPVGCDAGLSQCNEICVGDGCSACRAANLAFKKRCALRVVYCRNTGCLDNAEVCADLVASYPECAPP